MGAFKITRKRGDTIPDVWNPVDADGNYLDPTGFTFRMTVNSVEEPPEVVGSPLPATQLFQVIGVIVVGSPLSETTITFTPTAAQANQTPGDYFYDIQVIDGAGLVKTAVKDEYVIEQDITKEPD